MRQWTGWIAGSLILALAFGAEAQMVKVPNAPAAPKPVTWAVYYDNQIHAQQFLPYNVLLFDRDKHPVLAPLLDDRRIVLGYVSAGEAEDFRVDFPEVKQKGVFIESNKDWKGHYIVDVRKPEWAEYIIEEAIPATVHRHFNGLMLDTFDSVLDLEQKDPKKYAGMKQASIDLVKAIRMHYPDLKIMVNRGFDILPEVANDIDYVLAESIYTTYDATKKQYVRVPDAHYKSIVEWFKQLKARAPKLQVYSLDYWDLKDTAGVKAIYQTQRANGFIPYVSTMDLQALSQEPK